MGGASGAHTHSVTVAASLCAPRMSSCAGWLCQKLRMPKATPPAGPPKYPRPLARVPRPLSSQAWPSAVRLRMVKESAFGWNKRPVAEGRDVLQRFADDGREGAGTASAFDLRVARRLAPGRGAGR